MHTVRLIVFSSLMLVSSGLVAQSQWFARVNLGVHNILLTPIQTPNIDGGHGGLSLGYHFSHRWEMELGLRFSDRLAYYPANTINFFVAQLGEFVYTPSQQNQQMVGVFTDYTGIPLRFRYHFLVHENWSWYVYTESALHIRNLPFPGKKALAGSIPPDYEGWLVSLQNGIGGQIPMNRYLFLFCETGFTWISRQERQFVLQTSFGLVAYLHPEGIDI
ncbi:MAG: hypothetical protein AAF206_00585 [Bacteroidota bacterium]